MVSVMNLTARYHAFEVARENMEKLLVAREVSEMVEFGYSEKYPDIEWQTTVESFYEPVTNRMWIRAVCSAEYTDANDVLQTVELTNWLTDLTEEQLLQMAEDRQQQEDLLAAEGQLIESLIEASGYAGVDEETIQQWVNNGMVQTDNGYYIKRALDLYKRTDGKPTMEEIRILEEEIGIKPVEPAGSSQADGQTPGGMEGETDLLDELGPNLTPEELMEKLQKQFE